MTTLISGEDRILLTIHAGRTADVTDLHYSVMGGSQRGKVNIAHIDASKDKEVMNILEIQRDINKTARQQARKKRIEKEINESDSRRGSMTGYVTSDLDSDPEVAM